MKEVARKILRDWGVEQPQSWLEEEINFKRLQTEILLQQDAWESELKHPCVISDRGLDPLAYLQWRGLGNVSSQQEETKHVRRIMGRHRHALVIMLEPRKDCLCDDGVRIYSENIEELQEFNNRFAKTVYDANDIPFFAVPAVVPLGAREAVVKVLYRLCGGDREAMFRTVCGEGHYCDFK